LEYKETIKQKKKQYNYEHKEQMNQYYQAHKHDYFCIYCKMYFTKSHYKRHITTKLHEQNYDDYIIKFKKDVCNYKI
jgi:hypothetical protein